jgi:hypothetical protein
MALAEFADVQAELGDAVHHQHGGAGSCALPGPK